MDAHSRPTHFWDLVRPGLEKHRQRMEDQMREGTLTVWVVMEGHYEGAWPVSCHLTRDAAEAAAALVPRDPPAYDHIGGHRVSVYPEPVVCTGVVREPENVLSGLMAREEAQMDTKQSYGVPLNAAGQPNVFTLSRTFGPGVFSLSETVVIDSADVEIRGSGRGPMAEHPDAVDGEGRALDANV